MNKSNAKKFYESKGWAKDGGIHYDTVVNSNMAESAADYNSITRRRLLKLLELQPNHLRSDIADVGCGPIPFHEYIEYSRLFERRHCFDFSEDALQEAAERLKADGQSAPVTYVGDFLAMEVPEGRFDATISLHALYHVDISKQEAFVDKLLYQTKRGGSIIIVYSNPFSLRSMLLFPIGIVGYLKPYLKRVLAKFGLYDLERDGNLYFKRHNIFWWNRFNKKAEVDIRPFRMFVPSFEKKVISNRKNASDLYRKICAFEEKGSAAKYFADYYIVCLKKR